MREGGGLFLKDEKSVKFREKQLLVSKKRTIILQK